MTGPVLAAKGISVGYRGGPVIRGIDLALQPGEVTVLLGPNGAGKTTTLLALSGVLGLQAGTIEFEGVSTDEPAWRRARRGIAHLDGDHAVIRSLSVWDNLRLASRRPEQAFDLFPELASHRRRVTGLLSGGQQRMLAVAMALGSQPRVVLADELSLGLAPLLVQRLLEALRRAADGGAAILLVEQHARQALAMADQACVLSHGSVVKRGTAADVLADAEELASAYLGDAVRVSTPQGQ